MVPSQNLYEARMNLAREGLPRDSTVGFEIFEKTTFGATDFTQKMNYRRALQGEHPHHIAAQELKLRVYSYS